VIVGVRLVVRREDVGGLFHYIFFLTKNKGKKGTEREMACEFGLFSPALACT
jgi:hypothetical protein